MLSDHHVPKREDDDDAGMSADVDDSSCSSSASPSPNPETAAAVVVKQEFHPAAQRTDVVTTTSAASAVSPQPCVAPAPLNLMQPPSMGGYPMDAAGYSAPLTPRTPDGSGSSVNSFHHGFPPAQGGNESG